MGDDMGHHHLEHEMHVDSFLELKVSDEEFSRRINQQPRYLCPYGCQKHIASRTIDYHKNNGCGRRVNDASSSSQVELKKRFYCCGACLAEFVARPEFHAHLRIEHDVHPEIHNIEFPDRATFDRFKHWLEAEGGAHYRHKSGSKRRGRGKGIFLACNRSGNTGPEKGHGIGPDRTGPFRLGFTCTAYIHATEHSDGHVSAEFCGDHYGHDARMRLPNVIKCIIAQKQLEQCSPMEIIGFLRHHFLNLATENIYAQRICFVDSDELKAISTSCTKKWRVDGIPQTMELWESELLEKVGIEWPPSNIPHRFNEPRKITTAEIAIQERWPRPRVFVAKSRREDGVLIPYDLPGAVSQSEAQDDYGPEEEEMVDDNQYMAMEMGEYEVNEYVQDEQMVVGEEEEVGDVVVEREYHEHQEIINKGNNMLEEVDVEVEVGNEITVDSNNQITEEQKACVDDQVLIQSPSNEIVVVDGDVEEDISSHLHHHHHPHHPHHPHPHHQHQHHDPRQPGTSNVVERFIEANKANTLEQIMDEIEAFKITVLKKADQTTRENLKSLLIRFQTLHHSIMDKDHAQPNQSMTVFPNKSKFLYRPGKGLEKADEYIPRAHGEITLQPIDDEISDDEELMVPSSSVMTFNAGIWS